MDNKVIIAGAGAHCKVILDIIQDSTNFEVVGLLDSCEQTALLGVPIVGTDSMAEALYQKGVRRAFVAIGDNKIRQKVTVHLKTIGFQMINVVSRHAVVSRYAEIGEGIVIMPGAIVNAEARIGNGCILNTNCSVDHDCKIGDFCHVAPGCAISGSTTIGNNTFLGTRAAVIDRLCIGEDVMVAAGAVVVKNVPNHCVVMGVPAKIVNYK